MDFFISSAIAIVTAAVTSFLTVHQLRRQYLLEMRAETLARRLLSHKSWRFRTFQTLQYHIAGFADDELRRILIRAGAVRFNDDKGTEIWGLLERVSDVMDAEYGTGSN